MIGFILWALLLAAIFVLEGLGLTLRGHQWPTLSDMLRSATRPVAGRWLLFAFWLWIGWHLFIRGWDFFLRGPGARDPGHGSAGGDKPLSAIVTQVVIPLVAVYALFGSVLLLGLRAWRAGTFRVRTTTAAAARMARAHPLAFLGYVVLTTVAGYAVFVLMMGAFSILAGKSAAGVFSSAVEYGAFLVFAVALPVFCALSFGEAFLRGRRTGPTSGV